MRTTCFWNNLHHVRSRSKDWKAKQFNGLGAIKQKCINKIAKNQLRSPMSEGGELRSPMSEGGELRSPMSEGGELRSPMSEGGELRSPMFEGGEP